jgi:hypothetical protein
MDTKENMDSGNETFFLFACDNLTMMQTMIIKHFSFAWDTKTITQIVIIKHFSFAWDTKP